MIDMNYSILVGRLTSDPKTVITPNGNTVTNFTLANSAGVSKSGTKLVNFIDCQAWHSCATLISSMVKQGTLVAVYGKLVTESYTDNNNIKRKKTFISVKDFQFIRHANKSGDKNEQEPTIIPAPAPTEPVPLPNNS